MAAQPRAEAGDGSILDISRLTKLFGGLRAVSDFHMAVPEGRLYGLIGPNGAGKTTVFNMITGLYLPTEGSIVFDGRDLVGVDSHHITQAGVARTFQNIRLFQNLTVLDNVRIAYHTHAEYSMLEAVLRLGRFGREERSLSEQAQDLLAVFGLQDRQLEVAKNLPYGEQRRLEIARALAAQPRLLLLDEPAAGMTVEEKDDMMVTLLRLRTELKLTMLVVEHDLRVVSRLAERVLVRLADRVDRVERVSPMAVPVRGPTTPSALRPWLRCQRMTAARVAGPKIPSALAPTLRWICLTRAPRAPCLTRPEKVAVDSVTDVDGAAVTLWAPMVAVPRPTAAAATIVALARLPICEDWLGARWRPA